MGLPQGRASTSLRRAARDPHCRAITMGAVQSLLTPAPPLHLAGRATKAPPTGVRVCLTLSPAAASSKPREICAVSPRASRRAACGDACAAACAALPDMPGARRARAVCRRVRFGRRRGSFFCGEFCWLEVATD